MKRMRSLMLRLAIYVVLIAAGLYGVMFFMQGRAVFESDRNVVRTPATLKWAFEDVRVPVGRETTCGWYIPVEGEHERGVVLVCHGNGGNMGTHLDTARLFRLLNYSVLFFDYGGYGNSTGTPSEKRCYDDAAAMWMYLTKTRNIPSSKILVYGVSFGGGTACELARRVRPGGLILQSTYLSLAKAAYGDRLGVLVSPFLRYHFDNEAKIGSVRAPVLVIHSQGDTLYPFRHGQRLYELAGEPKRFVEIEGDHYDWNAETGNRIRTAIDFFFDSMRPRPPDPRPVASGKEGI